MTLPEVVISALQTIDRDLSQAIAQTLQTLVPRPQGSSAELITYGDRGVIIVPRNDRLKELTGVELVPVADGRALISFDDRLSIPQFELRLGDALADASLEGEERAIFEAIAQLLRTARRTEGVAVQQHNIIVMQRTNQATQTWPTLTAFLVGFTQSQILPICELLA